MDLRQLAHVLNTLPDPVLVIGRDQRVLLANLKAEELLEQGLVGKHLLSVIRQPQVVLCIQEVLDGKDRSVARFVSRRSVDTTYRVVTSALKAVETGLDGAITAFTDTTQAEQADRIQSDFVANVSHELRSPLTALSGFIETLQGPAADDPEARAAFLTIMAGEANRMKRLIDDLLSLSRVEVNERVRPTGKVDVMHLLADVQAVLGPRAQMQEAEITLAPFTDETKVPGDSDQLIQVFQNLIENAVKYGGAGQVRVAVHHLDQMPGVRGQVIRIDISDQGAGIEPLHIPRLTERFYRVDNHRARGLGGTGLGLAIVKHIINRHRGRLLISSDIGKGSVFSVILPTT